MLKLKKTQNSFVDSHTHVDFSIYSRWRYSGWSDVHSCSQSPMKFHCNASHGIIMWLPELQKNLRVFLGGWLWLSSPPSAVHVFREVRATTWAYFRLVHQQRAYLLHWSTNNITLLPSNRASEIKCMLNSRYSGHTKAPTLLTSWLTLLTKKGWKHCQRHYGPRGWLLWPVILVW